MATQTLSKSMALIFMAAVLAAACSGSVGGDEDAGDAADTGGDEGAADADREDDAEPDTSPDIADAPADGDDAAEAPADTIESDDGGDEDDGGGPISGIHCSDDPPPGSPEPDPLPVYSGEGGCPELAAGRNTIVSSGAAREFLLVLPEDYDGSEDLPVLFMWHYLGGSAQEFSDKGEVPLAATQQQFIAILPEAKGDVLLKWPYMLYDTEARIEEEAVFFDDMLTCTAGQYNVNRSCVSSIGVSSGGLWTAQLAPRRSKLLSSFISLSGGVGQSGDILNPVKPWTYAEHKLPAVVLWGGPLDFCGVTFATTSAHLEDALVYDGHFFVECIHNCKHAEPPMDPPEGESKYSAIWTFAFHHPYWLEEGTSPYTTDGIPDSFPAWCGIGPGSATIRDGECEGGLMGECF